MQVKTLHAPLVEENAEQKCVRWHTGKIYVLDVNKYSRMAMRDAISVYKYIYEAYD